MFVLGTAGHVDHGKSTLITRLTGIDPDRLAEEKARGLTIDLGFAWFTLPSGREVGIVDVPGHERFVHNMLAGAGQIDATIFVVDANEGWRPQSEEHLAILDLLGARGGVVALTKIDVARDVPAAERAVRERLAGTVLDGCPIVPVSAAGGEGIDELVATIDRVLDTIDEPADLDRPRLFVDRSFSIKGAGTVVTGTLTGGRVREGDELAVLPGDRRARVRSIQTHKTSRAEAVPTSRVALNLAGLDRAEIRRGDAVVRPGQWRPTTLVDVELRAVRDLADPITGRGAFLVYAGTAESGASLRLLGATELGAGGTAFARLRLDEPIVAAPGDRVVVRDTGRRRTVAGGRVLAAHPPHERAGAERIEQLRARATAARESFGDLEVAERHVVAREELLALAGVADAPGAIAFRSYFVSHRWLDAITARIHEVLGAFHAAAPLKRGMPREELRVRAGLTDARLFAELLDALEGRVVADGTLVRRAAHRVTLSPELDEKRNRLLAEIDAAGFSPPPLADLAQRYGAPLVKALTESNELVKLGADIALTPARIDEARRIVAAAIADEGGLTAARIKELLGTTRKYAIPLLEHLDATGFTKRDGDLRLLR